METQSQYYSMEGHGGYQAFINHFKKQADGGDRSLVIHTGKVHTPFARARAGRSRLVLVNTGSVKNTKPNGSQSAPLESVDPNEAERRRALAEAAREELDLDKTQETLGRGQSTTRKRKKQTIVSRDPTVKRLKSAIQVAKSKAKRIKDIFDD